MLPALIGRLHDILGCEPREKTTRESGSEAMTRGEGHGRSL